MKRAVITILLGGVLTLIGCAPASTQPDTPVESRPAIVRINQLGYPPDAEKLAVVSGDAGERFEVADIDGATVYHGELTPKQTWRHSGETVRIADFSALNEPGRYRLHVGRAASAAFDVRE